MSIVKAIDDSRGPITYKLQRILDNYCNTAENFGWPEIPFLGFFCVTCPAGEGKWI